MSYRVKVALAARGEYRLQRGRFEQMGVDESTYILSRLRDCGLEVCAPIPTATDPRPLHERLPGLVSVEPGRHGVGS